MDNCDCCKKERVEGRLRDHLQCVVEIYNQGVGTDAQKARHSLNRILGMGNWLLIPEKEPQLVYDEIRATYALQIEGATVAVATSVSAPGLQAYDEMLDSARDRALVKCFKEFPPLTGCGKTIFQGFSDA